MKKAREIIAERQNPWWDLQRNFTVVFKTREVKGLMGFQTDNFGDPPQSWFISNQTHSFLLNSTNTVDTRQYFVEMKEGGCKVDTMCGNEYYPWSWGFCYNAEWNKKRMFNNTHIEKIEVFERHKDPHYTAWSTDTMKN